MRIASATLLLPLQVYGFHLFGAANQLGSLLKGFSSEEPCLIKLGPDQYELVTEEQKFKYRRENIKFIDVTSHVSIEEAVSQGMIVGPVQESMLQQLLTIGSKQLKSIEKPAKYQYPSEAQQEKLVSPLFPDISIDSMRENLGNFTSFFNRFFKSETGLESAIWLQGTINDIVSPVAVEKGVTVTPFHHDKWDQFSIIVSIPGKNKSKSGKGNIVVIGSHQDSVNLLFPNLMRAPGADDDGSGTVTCLEALRLIIGQYNSGDFVPENTLEFHFYSAEEGGLLGSIDVFTSYKNAGEKVVAMLQQDMTGYTARVADNGVEPHMGLIVDYTSPELNNFVKLMIDTYCDIPYHETNCGYACSDHASASENGYPSSFVIESEMKLSNNYIHSILDTIDRIDWEHVKEHVKLTVGFAVELSSTKITDA
ncbi:hypothetical protein CAAN1_11S04236 [[Candida] anglica]